MFISGYISNQTKMTVVVFQYYPGKTAETRHIDVFVIYTVHVMQLNCTASFKYHLIGSGQAIIRLFPISDDDA